MSERNVVSTHAFLLIDPQGDAYVVQGIEIKKCSGSYGYDLCIVRETGEKVKIAWSSPEKDALIPIRESVLQHMIAKPGKDLDMRNQWKPNREYFGYYGCTIVPA